MSTSTAAATKQKTYAEPGAALEDAFPIHEISELAEQESWRKEINRPIYHIHKWWATRLGSVFRAITLAALSDPGTDVWDEFYKRHCFHDKVVLDPFMGSGTTLGEALKLGAKAVGCDINPVSTFQVRQAFTHVPEQMLIEQFDRLEAAVADDIRHYYKTIDPQTGKQIPVLYYFWCKVVETPTGEELPLFSRYVFAQNAYPKKKPRAQIVCPSCWGVIEDRYDAKQLTCPDCGHGFNPQDGPAKGQYVTDSAGERHKIKDLVNRSDNPPNHRLYAMLALRPDGEKVYLPARQHDHDLYREAEQRLSSEALPLPTLKVRPGHNTDQARGYRYDHWRDFFNARQQLSLGLLLRAIMQIEDREVQEQFLCLFSSALEFNNLFCSYKGEGTGAVRHMFSNHILKPERTPLENSVWGTARSSGTFSTLFSSRLLRAKRYLDEPFELEIKRDLLGKKNGTQKTTASEPLNPVRAGTWEELQDNTQAVMVLNGSSDELPIPDESVDAVVTDPPYFDFVHYSELSDFFFAWLSPVLKSRYPWMDREDSSDQGEVQDKRPEVFSSQLAKVFGECRRVLKPDGLLAFSFHHSRPEGWAAIYRSIEDAGLAVVAAHPVHAELRAASPKSAANEPIVLDAILVCKKRADLSPDLLSMTDWQDRTEKLIEDLLSSGVRLSRGDRFVIAASQLMIDEAVSDLDFETFSARLKVIRERIVEGALE